MGVPILFPTKTARVARNPMFDVTAWGDVCMRWTMPKKGNTEKLKRYRLHLEDCGIRPSVVDTYVFRVSKYLAASKTPGQEAFDTFRERLRKRGLKRSTINGYSIAIKSYHRSLGEDVSYKFLKVNNIIPYYLTGEEIIAIFNSIDNFKH